MQGNVQSSYNVLLNVFLMICLCHLPVRCICEWKGQDAFWAGVPGPESRLHQYSGNPYTCVLVIVECHVCAYTGDLLSLPAHDKALGWVSAARQNCTVLNYSSTAGEVLVWTRWKLWLVLTSLNTMGLWVAWEKLNPASSPGLPAGDEMPALLQPSPCPAQDSNNTSLSLSVFLVLLWSRIPETRGKYLHLLQTSISNKKNLLSESVSLLSLERDDW